MVLDAAGVTLAMTISKQSLTTVVGVTCLAIVFVLYSCGVIFPLTATRPPCMRNLQTIQVAKFNWMRENNKTLNDAPSMDDIKYLFHPRTNGPGWSNGVPVCPQGGHYILGRVGEPARCSIGGTGHSLGGSVF